MTDTTLEQVQRLADQLSPLDQVRLLEYLTPQILRAVASTYPEKLPKSQAADAWQEFFRIGDEIASGDTPETETLTAAVLAMRR